jgi:hypothetical protein
VTGIHRVLAAKVELAIETVGASGGHLALNRGPHVEEVPDNGFILGDNKDLRSIGSGGYGLSWCVEAAIAARTFKWPTSFSLKVLA